MITILIKNFTSTNKLNINANISSTKYAICVLKDSFSKILFICRKKIFLA